LFISRNTYGRATRSTSAAQVVTKKDEKMVNETDEKMISEREEHDGPGVEFEAFRRLTIER